jgi:DNA-binding beta-propeller fold protein YncE
MSGDFGQLEDRLRAAYADAGTTVQPDDISERAPAATSPVRWRAAARTGSRRTTALAAAAAVLLIVITATVIPHVLQSGSRPGNGVPSSHMAYVVSQRDLLIPVNLATGTALKPIPLGVAGGEAGVAISPGGKLVYVLTVRGQLVPVDVATGKAGRPIRVGGVPQALVMTPDGKAAYVLEPPYGVVAVDLATRTALGLIKIHNAASFALTPNGKTLYVVGTTMSTTNPVLTAIDTATNATISTLALTGPHLQSPLQSHHPKRCSTLRSSTSHGSGSREICVIRGWHAMGASVTMAPDGKTVYVSYESFKTVNAGTRSSGSIIGVNVASNAELKPIPAGLSGAQDFTISPDSQTAYLSEFQSAEAQSVTPVNLRTGAVLPSIPLPASQNGYGLTMSPDGGRLYATALDGSTVVPVDTTTRTALQPIQLRSFPRWQQFQGVFAPGGETLYVLSSFDYPKGALIAGRMTPVNAATGAVGKPIDFPAGLDDIIFSP